MEVAERFNCIKGDSRYAEKYDLNADNAINMADIMLIAEKFNTLA